MIRHLLNSRGILICVLALLSACRPAPTSVLPAEVSVSATRIVTLAPHLAELVHSAGAGDRLVGVAEFSDFPESVQLLPQVGNAFRVDYEAILALKPDLVIGWGSGNPPESLQRLQELGLHVVVLEPVELGGIADQIVRIGELAGTRQIAERSAQRFRSRLEDRRRAAAGVAPVRVFLQLSERPYFTVTDQHFLGQGLRLCGGRNVFGNLPGLTANVSLEAIIDAQPEAIIASDMGSADSPFATWQRWTELPAVKNGRLFILDADFLSRPSERILIGIQEICGMLAGMREAREPVASR